MSSVTDLLTKLKLHTESNAHREVASLSCAFLKANPSSLVALKNALVALIKMGRYAQAAALLDEYPSAVTEVAGAVIIEQAYIYYKLNRSKELHLLVPFSTTDRALRHILAQDLYRSGNSRKAQQLYAALAEGAGDDLNQLRCNSIAAGNSIQPSLADQSFNRAVCEIAKQDYHAALATLEPLSLDAARVQAAYCHQMLGNPSKAVELLQTVARADLLVLANNRASLNGISPSVLLAYTQLPALRESLTAAEYNVFARNRALVAYLSGKRVRAVPCLSLLPASVAALGKYGIDVELSANFKADARILVAKALGRPDDLALALTATQFSCDVGNFDSAVAVMENVLAKNTTEGEHLYARPGVTGLLLALYEHTRREKAAVVLLTKISDYYAFKLVDDDFEEFQYVKHVAFKLLPHDAARARRLLEELSLSCDYAEEDVMIQSFLNGTDEGLTPVAELTAGLDLEALVAQGLDATTTTTVHRKPHRVTKARRHSKYPREMVAQVEANLPKAERYAALKALLEKKPVDDERWLAVKDRSTYKPKKGKGKNATQGAISGVSVDDKVEDGIPALKATKNVVKKKGKKGKK